MRMRKKKNLLPRLERAAAAHITDPAALRGNWRSLYPAARALWLEIGCGKGRFAVEMAKANPDVLFIAMEKDANAALTGIESAVAAGLPNLFFIIGDATELASWFGPAEVSRLYLNFSDPWTRRNRFKRRLTYRGFLALYMQIVEPGASLCFKTDNRELFLFSITEAIACGLKIIDVTHNLHVTSIPNIMTEYEMKFAELGLPIHRLEAVFPSEPPRDLDEILREKPLSAKPRVNPGSLEYVGGDVRRTQGVG